MSGEVVSLRKQLLESKKANAELQEESRQLEAKVVELESLVGHLEQQLAVSKSENQTKEALMEKERETIRQEFEQQFHLEISEKAKDEERLRLLELEISSITLQREEYKKKFEEHEKRFSEMFFFGGNEREKVEARELLNYELKEKEKLTLKVTELSHQLNEVERLSNALEQENRYFRVTFGVPDNFLHVDNGLEGKVTRVGFLEREVESLEEERAELKCRLRQMAAFVQPVGVETNVLSQLTAEQKEALVLYSLDLINGRVELKSDKKASELRAKLEKLNIENEVLRRDNDNKQLALLELAKNYNHVKTQPISSRQDRIVHASTKGQTVIKEPVVTTNAANKSNSVSQGEKSGWRLDNDSFQSMNISRLTERRVKETSTVLASSVSRVKAKHTDEYTDYQSEYVRDDTEGQRSSMAHSTVQPNISLDNTKAAFSKDEINIVHSELLKWIAEVEESVGALVGEDELSHLPLAKEDSDPILLINLMKQLTSIEKQFIKSKTSDLENEIEELIIENSRFKDSLSKLAGEDVQQDINVTEILDNSKLEQEIRNLKCRLSNSEQKLYLELIKRTALENSLSISRQELSSVPESNSTNMLAFLKQTVQRLLLRLQQSTPVSELHALHYRNEMLREQVTKLQSDLEFEFEEKDRLLTLKADHNRLSRKHSHLLKDSAYLKYACANLHYRLQASDKKYMMVCKVFEKLGETSLKLGKETRELLIEKIPSAKEGQLSITELNTFLAEEGISSDILEPNYLETYFGKDSYKSGIDFEEFLTFCNIQKLATTNRGIVGGEILAKKLMSVLKRSGLDSDDIFELCDMNNNGFIERNEFEAGLQKLSVSNSEIAQMREILDYYFFSFESKISFDTFRKSFALFREEISKLGINETSTERHDIIFEAKLSEIMRIKGKQGSAMGVFELIDRRGKGMFSLTDFKLFLSETLKMSVDNTSAEDLFCKIEGYLGEGQISLKTFLVYIDDLQKKRIRKRVLSPEDNLEELCDNKFSNEQLKIRLELRAKYLEDQILALEFDKTQLKTQVSQKDELLNINQQQTESFKVNNKKLKAEISKVYEELHSAQNNKLGVVDGHLGNTSLSDYPTLVKVMSNLENWKQISNGLKIENKALIDKLQFVEKQALQLFFTTSRLASEGGIDLEMAIDQDQESEVNAINKRDLVILKQNNNSLKQKLHNLDLELLGREQQEAKQVEALCDKVSSLQQDIVRLTRYHTQEMEVEQVEALRSKLILKNNNLFKSEAEVKELSEQNLELEEVITKFKINKETELKLQSFEKPINEQSTLDRLRACILEIRDLRVSVSRLEKSNMGYKKDRDRTLKRLNDSKEELEHMGTKLERAYKDLSERELFWSNKYQALMQVENSISVINKPLETNHHTVQNKPVEEKSDKVDQPADYSKHIELKEQLTTMQLKYEDLQKSFTSLQSLLENQERDFQESVLENIELNRQVDSLQLQLAGVAELSRTPTDHQVNYTAEHESKLKTLQEEIEQLKKINFELMTKVKESNNIGPSAIKQLRDIEKLEHKLIEEEKSRKEITSKLNAVELQLVAKKKESEGYVESIRALKNELINQASGSVEQKAMIEQGRLENKKYKEDLEAKAKLSIKKIRELTSKLKETTEEAESLKLKLDKKEEELKRINKENVNLNLKLIKKHEELSSFKLKIKKEELQRQKELKLEDTSKTLKANNRNKDYKKSETLISENKKTLEMVPSDLRINSKYSY